MNSANAVQTVQDYLVGLQQRIVGELERLDGSRFAQHEWHKAPGEALRGRGTTCILEEGGLFERAGIGFSQVSGDRLPPSASAAHPEVAGRARKKRTFMCTVGT